MNEVVQSKLAVEIASKSLRIATLEAQNEELQAQLEQALTHNEELQAQLEQALTHNEELETLLETSTAPETEKGE
jgi:hypothetical protein